MRQQKMRNKLPEIEREKIVHLAEKSLLSDEGKEAIQYLKSDKRGFSDADIKNSIETFHLGYVPERIKNEFGDPHEFAGKLIIPLINQNNELKALSSRDWRENAFMKFFHESFSKNEFLFGLNIAKDYILKNSQAIVVEGEFDVISLHNHGLKTVVGCLSSNLCLNQISLLSRYCRDIFVVFDGDKAGKKALDKVKELSLEYCLDVYQISLIPVVLSDGLDPDEFIREKGMKSFVEVLKEHKRYNNADFKEFFK